MHHKHIQTHTRAHSHEKSWKTSLSKTILDTRQRIGAVGNWQRAAAAAAAALVAVTVTVVGYTAQHTHIQHHITKHWVHFDAGANYLAIM